MQLADGMEDREKAEGCEDSGSKDLCLVAFAACITDSSTLDEAYWDVSIVLRANEEATKAQTMIDTLKSLFNFY